MKKLLAVTMLPLAALLLLGAAACGGDDDDDSGDEGADVTATATEAGDDRGEETATEDSGEDEGDAAPDGDIESYFVALEEILIRSDEEQEAIRARNRNETFDTDEEYVTAVQEGLAESGQLLEGSALEISELDVPEEAQEAHADYLGSLQSVLILFSQLGAEVESATTADEADAAGDEYGQQIEDQNLVSEDACLALQDIADANDVDVDLECST